MTVVAEALAEAAGLRKNIASLAERARQCARYQEGEPPSEDAEELLAQTLDAIQRLGNLTARINHANTDAVLPSGQTVTQALATRESLTSQHKLITSVADAAAGSRIGVYRQLRSELRTVTPLDVTGLRAQADEIAKAIRLLDVAIQRHDWDTELPE